MSGDKKRQYASPFARNDFTRDAIYERLGLGTHESMKTTIEVGATSTSDDSADDVENGRREVRDVLKERVRNWFPRQAERELLRQHLGQHA